MDIVQGRGGKDNDNINNDSNNDNDNDDNDNNNDNDDSNDNNNNNDNNDSDNNNDNNNNNSNNEDNNYDNNNNDNNNDDNNNDNDNDDKFNYCKDVAAQKKRKRQGEGRGGREGEVPYLLRSAECYTNDGAIVESIGGGRGIREAETNDRSFACSSSGGWVGNNDGNAGRSISRGRGGEHHWDICQHHHVGGIQ